MEEYQYLLEDALVDLLENPLAIPQFYFDTDFENEYDSINDEEYDDDDDDDDDEDEDEEEEEDEDEDGVSIESISEDYDDDDDEEEEDENDQGAELHDESRPTVDALDMGDTSTRRQPNLEANRRRLSINNIVSPTSLGQGASATRIEDDDVLETLAAGDFSSPSQYSPFTRPTRSQVFNNPILDDFGFNNPSAQSLQSVPTDPTPPLAPPPLTVSPTRPTGGSMAPPRRRGSQISAGGTRQNKRQRTSAGPSSQTLKLDSDDDSLFGSSPVLPSVKGTVSTAAVPEPIDLTNAPEIPEEIDTGPDNRTKLRAFQCVICMDDVTNLTVTHCGHLFCAECLHQSLHTGTQQGRCPMCRQKVDTRPRSQAPPNAKSFWPLELKLKTRKRAKGKRKAEDGL